MPVIKPYRQQLMKQLEQHEQVSFMPSMTQVAPTQSYLPCADIRTAIMWKMEDEKHGKLLVGVFFTMGCIHRIKSAQILAASEYLEEIRSFQHVLYRVSMLASSHSVMKS